MAVRLVLGLSVFLIACGPTTPPAAQKSASPPPLPTIEAELLASDPTWGNTEGPAIDSKGTLFFCARGKFRGIVSWTAKEGGKPFVALDLNRGPGGLWIDAGDNIYVTLVGDRKIAKVTPQKKVTILAENFEPTPTASRGPNDLVQAPNKSIYFTDPNAFDGSAAPGTIYRLAPNRKVTVFDQTVVGPNGITISQDGTTLYVAGNTGPATAKLTAIPLRDDGEAGPSRVLATIPDCVADGMDVDSSGSVWLTCYSYGTAYRIGKDGAIQEKITTAQKALTNCFFGRGDDRHSLYLTSSDMERANGYVYRAKLSVPGFR